MSRNELIKELVGHARSDEYFKIVEAIALLLPKKLHEQLLQLVNGPVWDGDVISKSYRDELFECGLAIRVCHKGEQGYTGALYIGYSVLKALPTPDTAKGDG